MKYLLLEEEKVERNRGKCCSESIILEKFASPTAYEAFPPLPHVCTQQSSLYIAPRRSLG